LLRCSQTQTKEARARWECRVWGTVLMDLLSCVAIRVDAFGVSASTLPMVRALYFLGRSRCGLWLAAPGSLIIAH